MHHYFQERNSAFFRNFGQQNKLVSADKIRLSQVNPYQKFSHFRSLTVFSKNSGETNGLCRVVSALPGSSSQISGGSKLYNSRFMAIRRDLLSPPKDHWTLKTQAIYEDHPKPLLIFTCSKNPFHFCGSLVILRAN